MEAAYKEFQIARKIQSRNKSGVFTLADLLVSIKNGEQSVTNDYNDKNPTNTDFSDSETPEWQLYQAQRLKALQQMKQEKKLQANNNLGDLFIGAENKLDTSNTSAAESTIKSKVKSAANVHWSDQVNKEQEHKQTKKTEKHPHVINILKETVNSITKFTTAILKSPYDIKPRINNNISLGAAKPTPNIHSRGSFSKKPTFGPIKGNSSTVGSVKKKIVKPSKTVRTIKQPTPNILSQKFRVKIPVKSASKNKPVVKIKSDKSIRTPSSSTKSLVKIQPNIPVASVANSVLELDQKSTEVSLTQSSDTLDFDPFPSSTSNKFVKVLPRKLIIRMPTTIPTLKQRLIILRKQSSIAKRKASKPKFKKSFTVPLPPKKYITKSLITLPRWNYGTKTDTPKYKPSITNEQYLGTRISGKYEIKIENIAQGMRNQNGEYNEEFQSFENWMNNHFGEQNAGFQNEANDDPGIQNEEYENQIENEEQHHGMRIQNEVQEKKIQNDENHNTEIHNEVHQNQIQNEDHGKEDQNEAHEKEVQDVKYDINIQNKSFVRKRTSSFSIPLKISVKDVNQMKTISRLLTPTTPVQVSKPKQLNKLNFSAKSLKTTTAWKKKPKLTTIVTTKRPRGKYETSLREKEVANIIAETMSPKVNLPLKRDNTNKIHGTAVANEISTSSLGNVDLIESLSSKISLGSQKPQSADSNVIGSTTATAANITSVSSVGNVGRIDSRLSKDSVISQKAQQHLRPAQRKPPQFPQLDVCNVFPGTIEWDEYWDKFNEQIITYYAEMDEYMESITQFTDDLQEYSKELKKLSDETRVYKKKGGKMLSQSGVVAPREVLVDYPLQPGLFNVNGYIIKCAGGRIPGTTLSTVGNVGFRMEMDLSELDIDPQLISVETEFNLMTITVPNTSNFRVRIIQIGVPSRINVEDLIISEIPISTSVGGKGGGKGKTKLVIIGT